MSVMINSTKNKFDRVVKTLGFIPFSWHRKNTYFIELTGKRMENEEEKKHTHTHIERRNTHKVLKDIEQKK